MKRNKKYILILMLVISIIIMYAPISYGIVEYLPMSDGKIVSKGVMILLSWLQVLEYATPILFLIIKLITNKKKQNNKNSLKNICVYILISILIFGLFVGVGELILKKASDTGYSSKTIDYINYNGKIVYFHK